MANNQSPCCPDAAAFDITSHPCRYRIAACTAHLACRQAGSSRRWAASSDGNAGMLGAGLAWWKLGLLQPRLSAMGAPCGAHPAPSAFVPHLPPRLLARLRILVPLARPAHHGQRAHHTLAAAALRILVVQRFLQAGHVSRGDGRVKHALMPAAEPAAHAASCRQHAGGQHAGGLAMQRVKTHEDVDLHPQLPRHKRACRQGTTAGLRGEGKARGEGRAWDPQCTACKPVPAHCTLSLTCTVELLNVCEQLKWHGSVLDRLQQLDGNRHAVWDGGC